MDQDAIRKAAILIAAADHTTADALLERLDPEQAAAVRRCAVQLQEIDESEQNNVLSEFADSRVAGPVSIADAYAATRISSLPTPKPASKPNNRLVPDQEPAGIDLSGDAVIQLRIPGETLGNASALNTNIASTAHTFDSLQNIEASQLATFLKKENPQAMAIVFSHLAPAQASAVLRELPAELRSEALQRLTHLEEMDESIVREVEQGLQKWISEQANRDRRRRVGLSSVVRILDAVDGDLRREMLTELTERDPSLLEQIQPHGAGQPARSSTPTQPNQSRPLEEIEPMSLEQVTRLRTNTLVQVLDACDRDTLVLAMAGAEPEVVSNLLSVLGLADGREIREGIAALGPVRLSDVDASQRRLGQLAMKISRPALNTATGSATFARAA